jgi:hypothetical protein
MQLHCLNRLLKSGIFKMCGISYLSQCSVEAIDWMKKSLVLIPGRGKIFFWYSNCSLRSPIFLFDLYQGIKQPGLDVDHLASFTAKVKNTWNYTSASPFILMMWLLRTDIS